MPISRNRHLPAAKPLSHPALSIEPEIRRAIEELQLAINDLDRRLQDVAILPDVQPEDQLPCELEMVARLSGPRWDGTIDVMARRATFIQGQVAEISPEYKLGSVVLVVPESSDSPPNTGTPETGVNNGPASVIYAGVYGSAGG